MDLVEIREQFVKLSGRYDLVVDTTTWADAGADFYIQAGQKFLEGLVQIPDSYGSLYLALDAGEYGLSWEAQNRVIYDVWVNSATDRWKLDKLSLDVLKESYGEVPVTNGQPVAFAVANLRGVDTTTKDNLGAFIENVFDSTAETATTRGIVIVPPADQTYDVQITGLFRHLTLASDSDENFWSIQQPELLLKAALYQLEVFSRGTENAKTWLSAIQTEVSLLENDLVDEEITGVDQMEG